MDSRAQLSVEYLITLLFAMALVLAAATLTLSLGDIVQKTQTDILKYREATIASLMS